MPRQAVNDDKNDLGRLAQGRRDRGGVGGV